MMTCDRLRALLEEHGLEGLQSNEEGRAHAAECTECFALLEAYGEVDRALASLPSRWSNACWPRRSRASFRYLLCGDSRAGCWEAGRSRQRCSSASSLRR